MAYLYVVALGIPLKSPALKWIGYLALFSLLINRYVTKLFYNKFEAGGRDLPTSNAAGIVLKDYYFYTKINSQISSTRKFMGYFYLLFRAWVSTAIGFLLFTILFVGIGTMH